MLQIGLYVHRLRVFEDYERLELGSGAGQFDLHTIAAQFAAYYERNFISADGRLSKLMDVTYEDDAIYGVIRYGSTGVASDIVDAETDCVRLRREKVDVEVIPLYFCFYTPSGEDTWYLATQSFGGRSCSTSFNRAFRDFASDRTENSIMVQKVMPMDEMDLARNPVQKLTLIRRHVPPEGFQDQFGNLSKELMMSLSIKINGRGSLGRLEDIRDRIADRSDVALVHEGIEFEEVQATVRVGSTYRKVGIIGASNNAGVVDVSDLVERDDDDFPEFESIHDVAIETLESYLIEYRDQ